MKLSKSSFLLIVSFLGLIIGHTQVGVTTFGIQYKPIIPNPIIGTFNQAFNVDNFESNVQQKLGNSFSMVIRQGLSNVLSFETGLSFTRRNFGLDFALPDSGYAASTKVGIVSYEIPFKALVFIRLGKDLFMNTAIGSSFNYYPSDVRVVTPIKSNEYFLQEGARLNRMQGALLADIGFEYRTRKSGYFYLGASYNLPFASIITFAMSYENPPNQLLVIDNVRGSYLTLDLRYYFNEKPKTSTPR